MMANERMVIQPNGWRSPTNGDLRHSEELGALREALTTAQRDLETANLRCAELRRENQELRDRFDLSFWSESQVDAVRGLLVYYLGGTQSKWSLRDHMRAGGYAIPLNEGEDYNSLPKNLVASLVLRIALSSSPPSEGDKGGGA